MLDENLRQSIVDEEHLKLLSLGYFISGGLTALFSLFALLYAVIGLFIGLAAAHVPQNAGKGGEPPPAFVGWLLGGVGAFLFLVLVGVAIARLWVALSIRRRKSRTLCLVVAALGCLEFPYGTLLGVLSFIVLGRESVARLFRPAAPDLGAAP